MTSKHLATFLMGAAAGAAMLKYNTMTPEEKEKLIEDLKKQAETVKTETEAVVTNLGSYFEEVSTKGMDVLKNYMGEAQKMADQFMQPKTETNTNTQA